MSRHHAELGVSTNATSEQIDQAYRRMSKKYHPDRPGGSEEKMKRINAAYDALKKPQSEVNSRSEQFNPTGPSSSVWVNLGKYDWSGNDNHTSTTWGFNDNDAPDDSLGGYSYNQHMEEMLNESEDSAESDRINKQTREAKAQGWTPERVEHMKCASCGESMEGTQPHEILNKVEPQTPAEKRVWENAAKWNPKTYGKGKLVGMHDECYEEEKRSMNFDSYCEICDQPKNNHNDRKCYNQQRKDMEW